VVILSGAVGAVAAALIVRVLRSSVAGGRDGASAARRQPAVATGGIAVLAAVVLGLAFAAPFEWSVVATVVVAVVAGAVSALGDRGLWPPVGRLVVSLATGVAVVAVGVRGASVGLPAVDVGLTVLWVALFMEATHLLDRTRGVAASVLAPVAAGLATVAFLADQTRPAAVLAALAGGSAAIVLAAPTHPRVRLGQSGSAVSGALLAAMVVQVRPQSDDIAGLALLGVLVALPLVLALVVVAGRLRHGVPVGARAADGVVERLKARKIGSGAALAVLASVQGAVSTLVVLADDGLLPVAVAAGAGAAAVALLGTVVASGRVHAGFEGGRRPAAWRVTVVGGVAAMILLVVAPIVILGLSVLPARAGANAIEDGIDAARDVDTAAAQASFAEADVNFGRARSLLGLPLVDLGRMVPVLGRNLAGARLLVDLGADVASAGTDVAVAAPQNLTVTAGAIPLEEIRATAPSLARAAETLQRGADRLEGAERNFLLGPIREGIDDLDARFADEAPTAVNAARAAELAPALFGGDGPRRYFVAMQNNSELRATGGFIGNFGELDVEDGQMELDNFARIQSLNEAGAPVRTLDAPDEFLERYERFEVATTWQSINISPDFPTVGRVIAGAYPQSGGAPVDGVIAIDPVGLAALLELAGSVQVEGWDEEVSSENVVDVTLRQAYERFDEQERRTDFLGDVAEAVMSAVTQRDLGSPQTIARVLGDAVEGGHLMIYLTREEEQAFAADLGMTWPVEPPGSDALLVVNQNASANKVDYYLRRTVDYDIRLTPTGGDAATVEGTLGITFENDAPTDGLAPYAAGGGFLEDLEPGENRTYLSTYSPLGVEGARLNGLPWAVESERELGRSVFSNYLDIAAGDATAVELDLAGAVRLLPGGWYELRIDRQPVLRPDRLRISVDLAEGWRVAQTGGGLEVVDGRGAEAVLDVDRPTTLRMRLEPDRL
jgi:hypothetical protein